jgi:hypothetical protein
MAASNTRFTQNSLGQSKTPIDSDHGIYRYSATSSSCDAVRIDGSDPGLVQLRKASSGCANEG